MSEYTPTVAPKKKLKKPWFNLDLIQKARAMWRILWGKPTLYRQSIMPYNKSIVIQDTSIYGDTMIKANNVTFKKCDIRGNLMSETGRRPSAPKSNIHAFQEEQEKTE